MLLAIWIYLGFIFSVFNISKNILKLFTCLLVILLCLLSDLDKCEKTPSISILSEVLYTFMNSLISSKSIPNLFSPVLTFKWNLINILYFSAAKASIFKSFKLSIVGVRLYLIIFSSSKKGGKK